uniref:DUF4476 domain-containing protein n=1 Tax=Parastrongyloides trichosuri TaxID=131310 RepID=A0A0N4ZDC9_PARTI
MKHFFILSFLFVVKCFAEDEHQFGLVAVNQNLTSIDLSSLALLDNKIAELVSSNNDDSSILKIVPTEIVEFYKDLTESDKAQLLKAAIRLGMKVKTKIVNISSDDVRNVFLGIPEDLSNKLAEVQEKLIVKYNKMNDNAKNLFTNYATYLKEKIEALKNAGTTISDKDQIEMAYKLVEEYLALSEDDRKSIGDAFETLNNFVNNDKLIQPLKTLSATSTLDDFTSVRLQILESLKNGDFNPTV